MNAESGPNIGLYFDADAYLEAHARAGAATGPAGLMGRQVAGKEFLDAYLTHGRWDSLAAVVRARERAEPLVALCRTHPSSRDRARRLTIHLESDFLSAKAASTPAEILHYPCPPEARFAWARRTTGARFALTGVTHTLSTVGAVQALCDLVTAPYEEFDTLVCTSRAVAEMVRAVTGEYAKYLAERFGGSPRLLPRLAIIPLGVDPERFRPATLEERAIERARIGAATDEVMVLCVGRLSHHAKAHPFPTFHAAQEAATRTGRKVRLVFAGWAAHPAIEQAYRDGAARFAPNVRVSFVDGLDPAIRSGVWRAADVFLSLPDNVQETFGLVVVEAMASALPVVGSEWNGYRDLIVDGETGYAIPTRMLRGATVATTARLMFGQTKYDHFLAECSQATIVDPVLAADALTRLVADAPLRRRLGAAGRERAVKHFTWERVIRAYESLWADQRDEVRRCTQTRRPFGPAMFPVPEISFAGYPTTWLDDADLVESWTGATDLLATVLQMPLTNLAADRRCSDATLLAKLVKQANSPRAIRELVDELGNTGIHAIAARATIAWLLKYGILRPIGATDWDGTQEHAEDRLQLNGENR